MVTVKLKIVPSEGFEAQIALAHGIHERAQVVPWKPTTFADCFTKPYYGVFAFHGQEVIGYAIVLEVVDEATLMDIAVDGSCRGKGIGRSLVEFVKNQSSLNGMNEMWLEVRESNHNAIKLYESSGFEHIETRKNYYTTQPTEGGSNGTGKENAKIMKWTKSAAL
ncbi:ribosomal protein S18-alanine N-acetyltransferase [Alteromonas gracilis]|uniref:ribosomal protein S18-alanine N-acetyltransferase n=1 Tax=Alteromonas gracilis TaxID=1479524 RepID=UPI003735BA2A